MGVWIETKRKNNHFIVKKVTPRVGVWIETQVIITNFAIVRSLPAWECGLKLAL